MVHPKTPDRVRFYNKPTCSKCQEAKKILDGSGVAYEDVRYLETPPSYDELKIIAKSLEGEVRELLRDKEARAAGWDGNENASDEQILRFLADHPEALQRPIIVRGERARVARPVERMMDLLPRGTGKEVSQSGNKPASEPGLAAGEHAPPQQFGRR